MPIKTVNNHRNKNIKHEKKLTNFLFCKKCTNMQLGEIINPKILYDNFLMKQV